MGLFYNAPEPTRATDVDSLRCYTRLRYAVVEAFIENVGFLCEPSCGKDFINTYDKDCVNQISLACDLQDVSA